MVILTGASPVVLITANGLNERLGGFAIRWQSLHKSLSRLSDVTVLPANHLDTSDEADTYIWPGGSMPPEAARNAVRCVADLRPELVVISELRLHGYLRAIAGAHLCPVVLDLHSVESVRAREFAAVAPAGTWWDSYYTIDRAELVAEIEASSVDLADQVWMCSTADMGLIRSRYDERTEEKLHVVHNAIEVSAREVGRSKAPSRIVFTGLLDYMPNVIAVNVLIEEIAPLLADRLPGMTIDIAGSGTPPTPFRVPLPDNVRLLGEFERIDEVISGGIMSVPMASGGLGGRFKVLEAFAHGVPVVSTSVGMDGLDVTDGQHFLRAESPQQFVDAFARLRADPDLRDRLVRGALAVVLRDHSIDAISESIAQSIQKISW